MARILDTSRSASSTATSQIDILLPAMESRNIVGTVSSATGRGNPQNFSWGSSGPWTTFYNYNVGSNSSDTTQAMHMLLGDGMADQGTSEAFYTGDMSGFDQRTLLFSNGNRVGAIKDVFYYSNNTSYSGHTFRILPVRNTTNNTISRTFWWYATNYWSSGYEGVAVSQFTPNNSVYSLTTSGNWSQLYTTSSGFSGSWSSSSVTVTIPSQTTVLVLLASTHAYRTTYRWMDINAFFNLNTTFPRNDTSLICDMRLLGALTYGRHNINYTTDPTPAIYREAAILYGDR